MREILVATTNMGKYLEIVNEFKGLPFKFMSLRDVNVGDQEPEEPFETTWENAVFKARYYALKSKLLTIAEDTAFGIDHLSGAPGVKAKRFGSTPLERNQKIIRALIGVPVSGRKACFTTSACVYDPQNNNFSIFNGRIDGEIAEEISQDSRSGLGYDSIFYYPPFKKCFAEISLERKNSVSHRGQIMTQVKNFLSKMFQ